MFGYTQLYEIHFYIRTISPSHMASYQQVLRLSQIYLSDGPEYAELQGTNNIHRENVPGIHVELKFNDAYGDMYKELLNERGIDDIPVELYQVQYKYFSASKEVYYRFSPVKSVFIDAGHNNYSHVVSHFISSNVDELLSDEEKLDISREYRKSRSDFSNNPNVVKLNSEVAQRYKFDNRPISVSFQEETLDAWKDQLTIALAKVPFDNIGFGTQNVIKTELAIKSTADKVNILLMEEPENNLSYTNMMRMLEQIRDTTNKQIFVATHSSYVANTLSLKNLFLVNKGKAEAFSKIPSETFKFFQKLPGYDTLRAVLANKIIFVEGPTDELIVEKCYLDTFKRMPIDDGIDIIAINGLSFRRFCDITISLKKTVAVITDNDCKETPEANVDDKMKQKYGDYYNSEHVKFFVEQDPKLYTIEPSVLAVNSRKDADGELIPNIEFQNIVCPNKEAPMSFERLKDYMENNKTEWALRVFESDDKIKYPSNIINVNALTE